MSDYEERVRQVVEAVALSEIDIKTTWPADRIAPIARAIATRVASQLASAAPAQLTSDEVAQLRHRLKDWRVTYETSALLVERLLDGARAAPALSAEERETLAWVRELVDLGPEWFAHQRHDAAVNEHLTKCQRAAALLDRLLGASR